jgi:hypothetical protein
MIERISDKEEVSWLVYADGDILGCSEDRDRATTVLFQAYQKDMGLDDAQREDLYLDLKLGDWFVVDPAFCSGYRRRSYFIRKTRTL